MTRATAGVFAALVVATFAAFFVAQALKGSPSVIQGVRFSSTLSPNQDGRFERVRFSFLLKETDDVTLAVVDDDGDVVRTLMDDRRLEAYDRVAPGIPWDGRDDAGRRLEDGRYKFRLTLRRQGRNVVIPRSVVLDTTAPAPRVTSVGLTRGPQAQGGPEILPVPGGGEAVVRFAPAGRKAKVRVFRMAPTAPREVRADALREGATSWRWDGTAGGRRVRQGTYLVVPEWRDKAGNVGTSVPLDRRGLPELPRGRDLEGRGGITVRYLGAQAEAEAVKARDPFRVCIDARRARYTWALRRIGQPRPVKRGSGTRPCVTAQAPGGKSGAYLFEVRTAQRRTAVPLLVQARAPRAGTRERPRGVLVVLPAATWQGRNPADDDGDGAPDVLDRGVAAGISRIYATADGLPRGFGVREAPFLGWLDRTGRRYDLTTDLALERGRGVPLAGHRGVVLPGDARWLTPKVRDQLRRFVRGGGTLVSLGTDSLRRRVAIAPSGRRLADPSPQASADLFGQRLRPLARLRTDLEVGPLEDEIGLFEGTDGRFEAIGAWEETIGTGRDADAVATAVTVAPPGKVVVVAARYGRGLVIRPGFPDFANRLSSDPQLAVLAARTWTLLSR